MVELAVKGSVIFCCTSVRRKERGYKNIQPGSKNFYCKIWVKIITIKKGKAIPKYIAFPFFINDSFYGFAKSTVGFITPLRAV